MQQSTATTPTKTKKKRRKRRRRRRRTFNFPVPFRAMEGKRNGSRQENCRQKKREQLLESRHTAVEVIAKYNYILSLVQKASTSTSSGGGGGSSKKKRTPRKLYYCRVSATAACQSHYAVHSTTTKNIRKLHLKLSHRRRFCNRKI